MTRTLHILSAMRVDLHLADGQRGMLMRHDARRQTLSDPRLHSHDELECNIVLQGRGRYLLGSHAYTIAKQHLVWFFPQQEHMIVEQSPDFRMWVAVFSPTLVRQHAPACGAPELMAGDPAGEFNRRLGAGAAAALLADCERLSDPRLDAHSFDHGLGWLLLAAWRAFAEAETVDPEDRVHPAVERAVHLLQDPDGPASLEALAAACELSPSRLSRLFHAGIGCTITVYRNRQRLQRFLDLIRQPGRSITAAALAAGFNSYGQFFRICRQLTGKSPRQLARADTGTPAGG